MCVRETAVERLAFGGGEGEESGLDGLGHDVEPIGDDPGVAGPCCDFAERVGGHAAAGDLSVDAVFGDGEAVRGVAATVVDELVLEDDGAVDGEQRVVEPDPADAVGLPQQALEK